MLMPSIFRESLFNDFMNDFAATNNEREPYRSQTPDLMRTDVRERDDSYDVEIELPGYKKDEIKMMLEDGYLTVSAVKVIDKTEDSKYVRRERFVGNVRRSFYVGNKIREEDIHPKYENGVLSFSVPKEQKVVEKKNNYLNIEG